MTKVLRFSHPRQVREKMQEQACAWLVKLDAGASDDDLRNIRAWIAERPEHGKALLEVAALWDQVSVLGELSELFPLARFAKARSANRRGLLISAALAAMFASIILLAGQADPFAIPDFQFFRDGSGLLSRSHETAVGQQSTVTLPDGSEIILNTNTAIQVIYSQMERKVFLLRGEGHFSVARNESRPFRVHAGSSVIEAVGTTFAVQRLQQDGLEVTVTEGRVNFIHGAGEAPPPDGANPPARGRPTVAASAAGEEQVSLAAGESASMAEGGDDIRTSKIEPVEVAERLAWRYGMLLFRDDSLEQVIKEVSRYTSIRIEVEETVRDIKVSGYFRTGDMDGLFLAMSETFAINVEKVGDEHVVLSPK